MAVSAIDQADFRLPPRIRSKPGPEPVDSARFMLAERIADLPFVQTVEDDFGVLPGTVGAFLKLDVTSIRQREPAVLFCRISHSGISVEGLTDAERHQVLSRGWGQLENRRVRLFMPRNDDELEICWGILYRAYHSIINTPVRSATMPRANVVDLPEISRTSLC
jgi:hypothetical protein